MIVEVSNGTSPALIFKRFNPLETMDHEEILKREDGSKVRICVSLWSDSLRNEFKYTVTVSLCAPRKRTWRSALNTDDYSYRKLNLEQREAFRQSEYLKYVTAQEIYDAKVKCWKKLEPK